MPRERRARRRHLIADIGMNAPAMIIDRSIDIEEEAGDQVMHLKFWRDSPQFIS